MAKVYEIGQYTVHESIDGKGPVFITFAPLRLASKQTPFGAEIFKKHGLNYLAVVPESNCWYQHREITDVISLLDDLAGDRKRIGYGSSMGGFAALNWSDMLKLDRVVAVVPQFSIQSNRAPWENRWREAAAKLQFLHDRIGTFEINIPVSVHCSKEVRDQRHARHIAKHAPNMELHHYPESPHNVLGYLKQTGRLSQFVRDEILNC